jgi:hypothetical protein
MAPQYLARSMRVLKSMGCRLTRSNTSLLNLLYGRNILPIKLYSLRHALKTAGVAILSLAYCGSRLDADFLVISLRICLCVDASSGTGALINQYADIFTGVKCAPGKYHISVDKSEPPVIHASRKISLNLRLKVQQH